MAEPTIQNSLSFKRIKHNVVNSIKRFISFPNHKRDNFENKFRKLCTATFKSKYIQPSILDVPHIKVMASLKIDEDMNIFA